MERNERRHLQPDHLWLYSFEADGVQLLDPSNTANKAQSLESRAMWFMSRARHRCPGR